METEIEGSRTDFVETAAASSHARGLDCERCLDAHLGFAAVTAQEVSEAPNRIVERRLTLGNLKAAEWHARALGRPDIAAQVRAARHRFADGAAEAVVALLSLEIKGAVEQPGPSDQKGGEF